MSECGCIAGINRHLTKYNARIMVSLLGPPRAFVETYTEKKIRGKKTPLVQASFCPFCGLKYEMAPSAHAVAEKGESGVTVEDDPAFKEAFQCCGLFDEQGKCCEDIAAPAQSKGESE